MGLLSSLLAGPSPPSSLPTLSLPLSSSSLTHLLSLLSTGETTSTQRFDPMELVGVARADLAIAVRDSRDSKAVTKPATNTDKDRQVSPNKSPEKVAKPTSLSPNLSLNEAVEEIMNINLVKYERYGGDTENENTMTKEDLKI